MIKFSAIEIWSKIPLKIKGKPCLALFSAKQKIYITQVLETFLVFYLLVYINQVR